MAGLIILVMLLIYNGWLDYLEQIFYREIGSLEGEFGQYELFVLHGYKLECLRRKIIANFVRHSNKNNESICKKI